MLDISLVCADLMGAWAEIIPVLRTIFLVLIGLTALVIIVAVLFQTGSGQDATAITGASESFYSQNKGSSLDDKLNRLTKICVIAMVVLLILYFVTIAIYPNN